MDLPVFGGPYIKLVDFSGIPPSDISDNVSSSNPGIPDSIVFIIIDFTSIEGLRIFLMDTEIVS
jgi:hypothetical protein